MAEKSHTKPWQRVAVFIIALLFVFTTGALTFAVIFQSTGSNSNNSAKSDQLAKQKKAIAAYKQKIYANNLPLKGYSAKPFDASTATKLETQDLKQGTGQSAKASDKLTVSYFGWLPNGKIFDSSVKKDKSGKPSFTFTPSQGKVIEGWIEGMPGMKVGGAREITIPAGLAYGSTGSELAQGSGIYLIKPNTPLKFIVILKKID